MEDGATQFENFYVNFHKFHSLFYMRLSQLGWAITCFVQGEFERMLTGAHKMQRMALALTFLLEQYHKDDSEFLSHIITGDCKEKPCMGPVIQNKRRGMLTYSVVLLHDSACPHAAACTRALLEHFNGELFDHPPYSPDVTPSNYHLFAYLKNWLGSQCFNNNDEFMEGVRTWLSSQMADYFDAGIQICIPRYDKCLSSGSDYVEKRLKYVCIFCIQRKIFIACFVNRSLEVTYQIMSNIKVIQRNMNFMFLGSTFSLILSIFLLVPPNTILNFF
jgi:hypothetical protein